MLDSIRKRKDNFIYSILIGLVVLVMAVYGVDQCTPDESKVTSGTAAWVNGEPISRREFQEELEGKLAQYQSMLGGQYDEKLLMAFQIPQRTLDELVQVKLLAQQSRKMRIQVPDKELAEHIRRLPYYQKNGKFDSELYSKIPNRGLQERQWRERLSLMKLHQYLSERVKPTPEEIRRGFMLRETKIDLEYAKIDFSELAKNTPISPKEIQDYLKAPDEKALQDYYSSHQKDFTTSAQVRLRQIRVGIPFKATDAQKATAKTKIEVLAKGLTAAKFAEVARASSDDEYAKKGGETGWVSRGSLEAPLEKALDTLEIGVVSRPVETTFGYFLLLVDEKKPEEKKAFEEVKGTLAEKVLRVKKEAEVSEALKKRWEGLLAMGTPLEPELKRHKVEIKKTGPFSVGQGFVPGVGQADALMDAVFELTPKSPTAKTFANHLGQSYYLKLVKLDAAKQSELAKQTPSVEKDLLTELQGELMNTWVKSLEKQATIKTAMKFDKGSEPPN